jgi:type I restriction enzyme R subunit
LIAVTQYGEQARKVLEARLSKYEDEGVLTIDDPKILKIAPFNIIGLPLQLIKEFGTRKDFEQAVHEMQDALYRDNQDEATA